MAGLVILPQAEIIKADLDKAMRRGGGDIEPRRMTPDIRYTTEYTSHLCEVGEI